MIQKIVFSKDRACQLQLFLRSFYKHYKDSVEDMTILYTYSDLFYGAGYTKLKKEFPAINFVLQQDFKKDLLTIVRPKKEFIQFFVDDDVIIKEFNLESKEFINFRDDQSIICLNPRLGSNINFCYTENKTVYPPSNLLKFKWKEYLGDFSYPMSLDGCIFRTRDILNLIVDLNYKSPNTLEGQLASHPIPKEYMSSFEQSILVNIPANRVQVDNNNKFSGIDQKTLNNYYLNNQTIKLEPIEKVVPVSCHQEITLEFEE